MRRAALLRPRALEVPRNKVLPTFTYSGVRFTTYPLFGFVHLLTFYLNELLADLEFVHSDASSGIVEETKLSVAIDGGVTYELANAENRRHYPAITAETVTEYNRLRARVSLDVERVLITAVEKTGRPRRLQMISGHEQQFHVGDRVESHGTLSGEWEITEVKYVKGSKVFTTWQNDGTRTMAIVCMKNGTVCLPIGARIRGLYWSMKAPLLRMIHKARRVESSKESEEEDNVKSADGSPGSASCTRTHPRFRSSPTLLEAGFGLHLPTLSLDDGAPGPVDANVSVGFMQDKPSDWGMGMGTAGGDGLGDQPLCVGGSGGEWEPDDLDFENCLGEPPDSGAWYGSAGAVCAGDFDAGHSASSSDNLHRDNRRSTPPGPVLTEHHLLHVASDGGGTSAIAASSAALDTAIAWEKMKASEKADSDESSSEEEALAGPTYPMSRPMVNPHKPYPTDGPAAAVAGVGEGGNRVHTFVVCAALAGCGSVGAETATIIASHPPLEYKSSRSALLPQLAAAGLDPESSYLASR
ncbi:hypothetical protein B0H11DRAFT_2265469 [Mycena galericulata]|nr:hypothetical protein B0H11DRAFT_2265469 [Mycena galericulata]